MKLHPQKVLEARERSGFSLRNLAEAAGVSLTSASKAEHGEEIRPLTARRIAKGLGVEVADLYPKGHAPTSAPNNKRRVAAVIGMPMEEFLRTLSEASEAGDEALVQLYSRLDAERASAEFMFRGDESNQNARSNFARAVERRMLLSLILLERGITPPDPEELSLQAEQLEQLQLH